MKKDFTVQYFFLASTTKTLKSRKIELERQLEVSQNAIINVPNLERFIDIFQNQLPDMNYEGKRQVLDMLGITIRLDRESIEITGIIDPGIVLMPSSTKPPPFHTIELQHENRTVWKGGKGVWRKLVSICNYYLFLFAFSRRCIISIIQKTF
jgi:hypothetical protein